MKKCIIFFLLVMLGSRAWSQLLDDSTKLVYGPKTTLSITENDIFYQTENWKKVDTLLTRFYRFTYKEKLDYLWQDLGVVGTAMRSFYPMVPTDIGATPGFTIFSPYFKSPADFNYYDTKSPHITFSLMLGGKGRSITDVLVTRNVTSRLNFGLHIRKLTIDKQIGTYAEADRHVLSTSYDAFGSYFTKDKRYRILANYSRMRLRVNESGGIAHSDTTSFDFYFSEDALPRLSGAQSSELRRNIHIYQQFGIVPSFEVYNVFDRSVQKNGFDHIGTSTDSLDFFDNFYIDKDTTLEQNRFDYFKNETGLKGRVGKGFYNVYYKYRWVNQYYKYLSRETLDFPIQFVENYGGARFRFDVDSLTTIHAGFEYLSGGNFRTNAIFDSKWLNARFSSALVQPAFIQRAYLGNMDAWYNYFKDPAIMQGEVNLKVQVGPLYIMPGFKASFLDNYIYFNQDTIPAQTTNTFALYNPSLAFDTDLSKHFHLSGRAIYTLFANSAGSYLHIPKLFINSEIYYKNNIFKGAMVTQIGINFHWNSAYYADNYYPVLQQYFFQNDYLIKAPLKMDLYLSGRLKSAMIFIKFVNLKQMFTKVGNLVAPFYPEQRYALDFGFTWYFYD